MTEMIDIRKRVLWPEHRPKPVKRHDLRPVRYAIDPTAFVGALIAAPLLVTAATFWVYFIPLMALGLGGPIYLAMALPVLLWDLPRQEPSFGRLAGLGFAASTGLALLAGLLGLILQSEDMGMIAIIYGIFGAIFAPLWAGFFAPLYLKFRRAEYARALI